MKPYKPSNQVPSVGFQWMLLSSILGGLAIGGLSFAIPLLLYTVLIIPLALGYLGRMVTIEAIRRGKVRNPLIAALFGALTGAIIYGFVFAREYSIFRQFVHLELVQKIEQSDRGNLDGLVDAYLQEQTGSSGLWGFIKYGIQQEISLIDRMGTQQSVLDVQRWSWIYWLMDLSVIEAIIIYKSYKTAKLPFCDRCQQWYGNPQRIGNVKARLSESFLHFIEHENYEKAGELVDSISPIYSSSIEIHQQRCPSCETSDVVMTLNRLSLNYLDYQVNLKRKCIQKGTISYGQNEKFVRSAHQKLFNNSAYNAAELPDETMEPVLEERAIANQSDRFFHHGLSIAIQENLAQQLGSVRNIKKAYLVRKEVQHFPEKPLYVLGIVRRRPFIDSSVDDLKLVHRLSGEIELPKDTLIVPLTKNKKLEKIMQEISGGPIYQR